MKCIENFIYNAACTSSCQHTEICLNGNKYLCVHIEHDLMLFIYTTKTRCHGLVKTPQTTFVSSIKNSIQRVNAKGMVKISRQ